MKTSHIMRSAVLALSLMVSGQVSAGGIAVDNDNDDAGKLTVSSKFFINATQNKTSINGVDTAKSTGIALDRAYLTVKYKTNDVWSMKLTADATLNTAATGKKTEVFIKSAFVQANFAPELQFNIGVIGTPWVGYENGIDGHRYIVKAYTDTKGFDASADAGLGLSGKFADGLIGYAVAAVNGKGYGDITATNAVDFNSRIGVYPVDGLTLDFQYRTGYKGTKTLGVAGNKSTLTQAMVTYGATKNYRVGANLIQNKITVAGVDTKTRGIAAWGRAKFGGDFGAYARYENSKVDLATSAVDEKENRYVVAFEYFANKNITMSLAWDQAKKTDRGHTIGATSKVSRYGLYTQSKF
jgi:hypothetical protein